ncbi:hypothetical protein BMR1_01G01877 [Babesia microti strain RI]|uniref:Uncharacterized protein n=1 Tax=Babesia microti (strain RI) TaxID=1133968 RepID=A0A1N6LWT4_BABMR|nr:hypothetical protein BMR1_01G01877 [Babesia microti strain RI]SIO73332.1 hypothetical protein BMR1_01G01877 [Babesia microti strain RI]|eukprot:XP_021337434.1 hypothetical protein BMR1_01G01877 [Babesia microti strain RI]
MCIFITAMNTYILDNLIIICFKMQSKILTIFITN